MLKMTISTSVWSVQHPNAGRNIQQTETKIIVFVICPAKMHKKISLISENFIMKLRKMIFSPGVIQPLGLAAKPW